MRKRRVLWTVLILFLFLATAALAVPPSRYVLLGHLRREQFYQGLPTGYWCAAVQVYRRAEQTPPGAQQGNWFLRLLGFQSNSLFPEPPAILCSDPAGLPVLAELLSVQDPAVRLRALQVIMHLDPRPPLGRTLPCFTLALRDKDPAVRRLATYAVQAVGPTQEWKPAIPALKEALQAEEGDEERIYLAVVLAQVAGPEAQEAIPVLRYGVRHGNETMRRMAIWALGRVGAAALPELREALKDPDDDIRASAAEALRIATGGRVQGP
jgi:HEAT repeat protein